jgi:hypothetical protein
LLVEGKEQVFSAGSGQDWQFHDFFQDDNFVGVKYLAPSALGSVDGFGGGMKGKYGDSGRRPE